MDESDLKRQKRGAIVDGGATVALTDTELVPYDEHRVSLVIQTPPTNRVTITWSGTAVLDQGVTLYPTQYPLELTLSEHGALVKGPIRAISAVAGQFIYWAAARNGNL